MTAKQKILKVAVLCGGPSPERGISLNSARSVSDHLSGEDIDVSAVYFDFNARPFLLSKAQLYSNTPSDFDFKLQNSSKPLSEQGLVKFLKSIDLVFPAMHGRFGEDGQIQRFLERHKIPFVGSGSEACERCFDKAVANEFIAKNGFYAIPSLALPKSSNGIRASIDKFFKANKISRAVIKPAVGGSSIGVYSVTSVKEAEQRAKELFDTGFYKKLVVEPFCDGIEFTSIILENRFDLPVCLLPVEIEADYFKNQIFDYRKKYLPTRQVTYHCPPRFRDHDIERIAFNAEALFKLLQMRDVARFDGWLMEDGKLWFSDFNPVSGMEQNSFLFLQAARLGMTHKDVLRFIVARACQRNHIAWDGHLKTKQDPSKKKRVNVIFGGSSAERQVSVMSGTNCWLKLQRSQRYHPDPYLLDVKGNVWSIPYGYALNHTVEEITENCEQARHTETRLKMLREKVVPKLFAYPWQISLSPQLPTKMTMTDFLHRSEYVFLGLHGGIGENGTLQRMMTERGIGFNGSGPEASRLCMDKAETAAVVKKSNLPGVFIPEKVVLPILKVSRCSDSEINKI